MAALPAKQVEKSRSRQKKRSFEKVGKVVLQNPYPDYWPLLDEQDTSKVTDLLLKLIIPEKNKPKLPLPWKKFKKLSKVERKAKTLEMKLPISDEIMTQRRNVIFGLNGVIRNLEKHRIASCLLAADVEPPMIVKSALHLAVSRDVSVFILGNMKSITKSCLGYSAIALGITVSAVTTDTPFCELHNFLESLKSKYPVQKVYKRAAQEQQKPPERILKKAKNPSFVLPRLETDVYCYRTSNTYRAFVPENYNSTGDTLETAASNKIKSEPENCPSTSDTSETAASSKIESESSHNEEVVSYIPVKLKRVKKNEQRKIRNVKKFKKAE